MTYLSLEFFALVILILFIYYLLPMKFRWISLLFGSLVFYCIVGASACGVVIVTALFSYTISICIESEKIKANGKKILLFIGIFSVCLPWLFAKNISFFKETILTNVSLNIIIPLGISYYTLMLIAYMTDVYRGKINVERNFFKFLLFVIFFPHIVQGPIPKYERLSKQLYSGNTFSEENISRGFVTITFGFFLKLMIADKIAPVVNNIFSDVNMYIGVFSVLGCILFTIQLYTDFYACTSISKGVSLLFGIKLDDNFRQPFNSLSNKEFWGRWHMSLGAWLKEYIYIPLGGSKKGKIRKYINLLITFGLSGLWHGFNLCCFMWGILNALFQILGDITLSMRQKIAYALNVKKGTKVYDAFCKLITACLVTVAFVLLKASNISDAFILVKNMCFTRNFWVLTDGSLYNLGLSEKGWFVFILSLIMLALISKLREDNDDLAGKIASLPIVIKWPLYLLAIFAIMTFGTYGMGFDANAFIYGGF